MQVHREFVEMPWVRLTAEIAAYIEDRRFQTATSGRLRHIRIDLPLAQAALPEARDSALHRWLTAEAVPWVIRGCRRETVLVQLDFAAKGRGLPRRLV